MVVVVHARMCLLFRFVTERNCTELQSNLFALCFFVLEPKYMCIGHRRRQLSLLKNREESSSSICVATQLREIPLSPTVYVCVCVYESLVLTLSVFDCRIHKTRKRRMKKKTKLIVRYLWSCIFKQLQVTVESYYKLNIWFIYIYSFRGFLKIFKMVFGCWKKRFVLVPMSGVANKCRKQKHLKTQNGY